MSERNRPRPAVDPATGRYQAPLTTLWRKSEGSADSRPVDVTGRILLDDAALARTYTCMSCNAAWACGDPGFHYYEFGPEGSPTEGMIVGTKGWFARCVDREACEHRRANNHAGQHPEALTLGDEARVIATTAMATAALL